MEGQRMSWYDDGEKGVGPVIASLSLGFYAEMKFRQKPKKKASKLTNEVELDGNNDFEKGEEKGSEKAENRTYKVEQIAVSTMNVQLSPFRNLSTHDADTLPELPTVTSDLFSLPTDSYKVYMKKANFWSCTVIKFTSWRFDNNEYTRKI